ncbi:hypothetical protein EZJ19_07750 [Parasulfuritortus cantonensis]|uniref:Uncharacterized protein n=1 Tax=Parasulfuritortus cantonensis TaxID=2528202 RepID=A0A4R1BDR6_9PROT|nr:hypothetical protein [Parasulfuritortus cantonensis]TCJ15194.1 hypothetical protein EZJ19_07750 [Parasulfuritortus cantonensis]
MEPSTETKILESLNFIAGTLALMAADLRALRAAQHDPTQANMESLKDLGDWLARADDIGKRIGKDFLKSISPASPG